MLKKIKTRHLRSGRPDSQREVGLTSAGDEAKEGGRRGSWTGRGVQAKAALDTDARTCRRGGTVNGVEMGTRTREI